MNKLNIISKETAPMQLRDFMNIPKVSPHLIETLYWYKIQNTMTDLKLSEVDSGQRFKLLKDAVLSAKSQSNCQSEYEFFLEFGFSSGKTLNFIAAIAHDKFVYGFESGNGIGKGDIQKKDFAYTKTVDKRKIRKETCLELDSEGNLVPVERAVYIPLKKRKHENETPFIPFTPLCNVKLLIGDIKETLPFFLQKNCSKTDEPKSIPFVFIDVNDPVLTKEILMNLSKFLSKESVLVVDHKVNYNCLPVIDPKISQKEFPEYTQDNVDLNFGDFIQMPPDSNPKGENKDSSRAEAGNNVLHFNSKNRDSDFKKTTEPVIGALLKSSNAQPLSSDSEILQFAVQKSKDIWQADKKDGKTLYYLEFGFCSGRTTNFISSLLETDEKLFAFDSGQGLQEHWRYKFPQGTFRYLQQKKESIFGNAFRYIKFNSKNEYREKELFIPFIPDDNVHLVLGYIESTLDLFIEKYLDSPNACLAAVFIDTDLYEIAYRILNKLANKIVPKKTIVVFDEAINIIGTNEKKITNHLEWQKHEFKALEEFAKQKTGYTPLAYNYNGQQLIVYFN